ncbi:alpha/beta hydrolase [Paracoccus sp. DMF]|uniref:alpha/beta hydrolase n=1 Tax=Paracoccus sp. DMF TaxID=400837 RepID=UPI0021E3AFF8|nr:alpha/beta hydrolase [Paracoccus sp. DMF]MCV2446576.1 alpha/beta hydrolase [Paracoccus sp. DMF]
MTRLYRGMDRAALDLAYDNSGHVADFPGLVRGFQARSQAMRAGHGGRYDLRYGEGARERFDWLPCGGAEAPVFVFVHGGYWQSCDKEDFTFIAAGPLARGWNVVLAEYALAPATSMTGIVKQIGRLLDHLAGQPELGTGPMCLAGHSAGGHLAALYRGHPAVGSVLAISGLYDLEPISLCGWNDPLQLTEAEIDRFSPQRQIGPGAPTLVAVGAEERPELLRQSRDYAAACRQAGETAELLLVAGRNHFDVLDDLADPQGAQLTALAALGA